MNCVACLSDWISTREHVLKVVLDVSRPEGTFSNVIIGSDL